MEKKLQQQIRGLQIYAALLTIAVVVLAVYGRRTDGDRPHYKQLDAERINIVEGDGTIRMVISNKKEQHPGRMDGKDLGARERGAGMIFFNDEGDECGGLAYDGNKQGASMVLSLDQYKNDQVVQVQYVQEEQRRAYGLKLWDRSDALTLSDQLRLADSLKQLHDSVKTAEVFARLKGQGLLGPERLFLGKNRDREVGLFLRDDKGRLRVRIGLDSLNRVVFQAYDSTGHEVALAR